MLRRISPRSRSKPLKPAARSIDITHPRVCLAASSVPGALELRKRDDPLGRPSNCPQRSPARLRYCCCNCRQRVSGVGQRRSSLKGGAPLHQWFWFLSDTRAPLERGAMTDASGWQQAGKPTRLHILLVYSSSDLGLRWGTGKSERRDGTGHSAK